jgi:hypothetical protein
LCPIGKPLSRGGRCSMEGSAKVVRLNLNTES